VVKFKVFCEYKHHFSSCDFVANQKIKVSLCVLLDAFRSCDRESLLHIAIESEHHESFTTFVPSMFALERLPKSSYLQTSCDGSGELVTWYAVLWLCHKNLTSIQPQQQSIETEDRGESGVDQSGYRKWDVCCGEMSDSVQIMQQILSIRRIHSTQQSTKDRTNSNRYG
jgi:hypothetical protein